MRQALPLLCLFAAIATGCAAAPDSEIDGERADEMINGTPRAGGVPYVYLSQLPGGSGSLQRCSGLALSANWILTAEHCFRAARSDGYGVPVSLTSQPRAPIAVQVAGTAPRALGVISQQIRFPTADLMLLRATDPIAAEGLSASLDQALASLPNVAVGDTVECWTNGPSTIFADGGLGTAEPRRGRFRVASVVGSRFVVARNEVGGPLLVSGDSGSPCFKADANGVPRLAGVVSQVDAGGTAMTAVAGLASALRSATSLEFGAKSLDGDGDGVPDLFFRKEPMEDPLTALRSDGTRILGEWRFPRNPALKNLDACSRAAASGRCEEALDVELQVTQTDSTLSGAPWQVIGLAEIGSDVISGSATGANRTDLVLWDETSKMLAVARRRIEGPHDLVSPTGARSRVRVDASVIKKWVVNGSNSLCGVDYAPRPIAFGRFAGHPVATLLRKDGTNLCLITLNAIAQLSSYREFLAQGLRRGEQVKAFTDFDGDGKLDFAFESPVMDSTGKAQITSNNLPVWKLCFRTYDPQFNWQKLADTAASKDSRCTQLAPGQRVLGAADIDLDGRAELLVQDPAISRLSVLEPRLPTSPFVPAAPAGFGSGAHTLGLSPPSSLGVSIGSIAGGIPTMILGPRVMTSRAVISGRILAYRVQRGDFNGERAMLTLDDTTGTMAVPHPYVLGTPPPGMVPVAP